MPIQGVERVGLPCVAGQVKVKRLHRSVRAVMAMFGLALVATGTAKAESLWSVFQPACASNGVDDDQCLCVVDAVVEAHGEQPARYVALDMVLRYDDAAALLAAIDEDEAYAASETFDLALNRSCSSSRLARLAGIYTGAGAPGAASTAVEAASMGAAASDTSTVGIRTLTVITPSQAVIDLRGEGSEVIGDVNLRLADDFDPFAATRNMRNLLGFYEVVDLGGGIDTNGDGVADLKPGDPTYAQTAQARAESTKLYLAEVAGKTQYLGEIRFPPGKMFAPFVRMRTPQASTGLPFDPNDLAALQDMVRNGIQGPTYHYFVFGAANTPGGPQLRSETDSYVFSADGAATRTDATFDITLSAPQN